MIKISINFILGYPQDFKGLKIYPVRLKNYEYFFNNINCLLYNKNEAQDVEIVKMSYLRFLLLLAYQEEVQSNDLTIANQFENILNLCLGVEQIDYEEKNNGVCLILDGIEIPENHFDKIKEIIFEQNMIEKQEVLNPELKQSMQDAKKYKNKKSNEASLEEKIIAYHCETGMSYEDIAELTIFQFNKGLARMDMIKHYHILKTAESSGFVEFKEQIPHWLDAIKEKGIFDDVRMSKEEFDKITSDFEKEE